MIEATRELQQARSETAGAILTVTQETLYRPHIVNYPHTMPPHGLPTCAQCGRPIRNGQLTGEHLCSARCWHVAAALPSDRLP